MTELNDSTTVPANNLCTGRLATHLDGFATLLDGQGYAPATVRQKNDLLADFGAWLAEHDVPLEVLGEAHAGQFLTEYHRRTRRGERLDHSAVDRISARHRPHSSAGAEGRLDRRG